MAEKALFTGKTHTTNGGDGHTRSSEGSLDLELPEPHPMAERLFAAAWSACYMGAIELAAARKKVKLPTQLSVDAEIELVLDNNVFFLRARLNVSVPGIDRDVATELINAAHGICPYSKAVHGRIDVQTMLV